MLHSLSELPFDQVKNILSYSSFEDLMPIEAACNGTIGDVLRSETGCRLLQDIIARGGIVITNREISANRSR